MNLLLLGPLLYFYFEIPPYSVLLNLIVIPAMPVAMTAGAAGSLLALVSDAAGGAVLAVCKAVLAGYDLTCGMSSRLPYSRYVTGRPDMWWLILYYLALAALYVLFVCLRGKQERALRQCGNSDAVRRDIRLKWQKICRIPGCALLIFAAGMAFSCRQGYQMGEGVQVAALDVGQGDCLYVRGPSAHFLIDGGSSDVSDAAAYRIEPYLLSQAVEELDYVFVTHGDEDHINGIAEMLNNQRLGVKIKNLVLPPERYHGDSLLNLAKTAQEQGTRVMVMKTGDAIVDAEKEPAGENAPALTLACLGPDGSEGLEADNSASLVLEASYGAFHMLFTGDLEERGEKLLVESGRLGACQVLKAAHHGSKNSGSDEFFQAVQPRITLISAGRDNRYGHPHKETLDRLKEYGSRVYSTQEYGTVTVWTDGETVKAAGFIR